MMSSKCKQFNSCKDYKSKFYNCDSCRKGEDKSSKGKYCVINVSSKSIPSVEGSGLTSPVPSALF